MRYNIQWIVKHKGSFEIDDGLKFPDEMFEKFSHINGLKDVIVQGTGNLDAKANRLYVKMNIKGTMILPCALTLEEIDYPFDINCTEIYSFDKIDPEVDIDIREAKKGIVDLTPAIFENIMYEVPMRVVKEDAKIQTSGKGWKIVSQDDEDDDYIDPRLAKLKDYFKDK